MDKEIFPYLFLTGGVFLGYFVTVRAIAITGGVLVVAAVIGLAVSAWIGNEKLAWMFGVSSLGLYFAFFMLCLGSVFGAFLKRIFSSDAQSNKTYLLALVKRWGPYFLAVGAWLAIVFFLFPQGR